MRVDDLDEALAKIESAGKEGRAISVALWANAAEVYPELVRRNILPDLVTEQTAAHDPLNGYVPLGLSSRKPLTYAPKIRPDTWSEPRPAWPRKSRRCSR